MSKSVETLSKIRQALDALTTAISEAKNDANNEGCGREMALVLTKIEEARMWAGKGLQHFDTGSFPSDVANQPETFSKEVVEQKAESIEVEATPTEAPAQA